MSNTKIADWIGIFICGGLYIMLMLSFDDYLLLIPLFFLGLFLIYFLVDIYFIPDKIHRDFENDIKNITKNYNRNRWEYIIGKRKK